MSDRDRDSRWWIGGDGELREKKCDEIKVKKLETSTTTRQFVKVGDVAS